MRPSRRSVGASTHALIYAFASADESAVTHARVAPYTNEANVHANMRACEHALMCAWGVCICMRMRMRMRMRQFVSASGTFRVGAFCFQCVHMFARSHVLVHARSYPFVRLRL
jgi:hypothetical protein